MLDDGRPVLLDFGSARRASPTARSRSRPTSSRSSRRSSSTPTRPAAAARPVDRPLRARRDAVLRARPGARRRRRWCARCATCCRRWPRRPASTCRASAAGLLATVDWTLALAPEQRPQDVETVRRALRGELAPPPPSPRQVGTPVVAGSDESVATVDNAAREGAHEAAQPRRWLSRRAPGFWGAGAGPDPKPSLSRRAHLGVAISFALLGIAALGWAAWTFNRPAAPPSVTRLSAAPAPATTSPVAMSTTAHPAGADPVALWVERDSEQAAAADSAKTREAVPSVPPRSISGAVAAPQSARPVPRDRQRAARPKSRTASAAVATSPPAKRTCDASGLLGRAWCALNPCKAAGGRANPECMERLRAEAARQQRVERQ